MRRFVCAVIATVFSVMFARGERAVWTLHSGNSNANGLTAVTWLAADGVTTSTTVDSEADYVVSDKTIYISSVSSMTNIFNGHSLTIGDIANDKTGAIFHYGGQPVSTVPATFNNDGVILARGDWKTQYAADSVYQVVGKVTVTATSDKPFRMYRNNTGGGVNHGICINGSFCGSGYLQVGHGVGSGTNLVLYLAGGCTDFSGNVSVASSADKRGALVVTNTTTTGAFSIGAGSDLSMFADTDVFTAGSLTLAAGSTLNFKASDYTDGTRQIRNNRIVLTDSFSAATGVNVKIDFADSANGKYSDALDLITVPDSQALDAADFTFVPTDSMHLTAAFSVRNDAAAHTKTLVLTFEGSGITVLTLKTSSNDLGIDDAIWSDDSTGTSADCNYVVLDGKELYISSSADSLNVFNGNSLQLGNAVVGSIGLLRHYGGYPVTTETPTFGHDGIVLACGSWRPRYGNNYRAAGKIKVTASAASPFRVFCDYDNLNYTVVSSLTWLGPLSGEGALQIENGFSNRARCIDFCLYIYGGASEFTGTIAVTSQFSNAEVDCRAGLALTNGLLPATISIATNSYLKFPGLGETTTLSSLKLDAGADLIVNASVSVSGDTTNRATGAICVTNAFTMTGPVNLNLTLSQDSACGGVFTILTVPYGSAINASDFNLNLDADKLLARGAALSVVEDAVAEVKRLTLSFEESSVVYQTESDLVTAPNLVADRVSSMTNALNWSDFAVPHAGAHYFCDAGRFGKTLILRTPTDDISAWTFPGKSLSILGGVSSVAAFTLLHTEFTIPELRFVGPAGFHPKYSEGGVTVHGAINVESGNVVWYSYAGGIFAHDGEITGSGSLTLTGLGSGSQNPGGYFEFYGTNTAFSGPVTLTISSGNGAPSTEIDVHKRRKFETLYLNDGRNLGGAMSPADPKGVSIDNCSMVITRNSLTVDEPTRGWFIGYMGRLNVISNDHVMTFKSPLAVYGILGKEGEGMLVMGNPQPTFGPAGTDTTPDADSTNRQFVVSGGDVKVTSAYALNGLDIICTNAVSKFILDAETENADMINYGIVNILTPGMPFAVDGEASKINVGFTCADEPSWSKKTLAICTVKATAADAVEALLKDVRITGRKTIIEAISCQDVMIGDVACVTFKAAVTTSRGMTILIK